MVRTSIVTMLMFGLAVIPVAASGPSRQPVAGDPQVGSFGTVSIYNCRVVEVAGDRSSIFVVVDGHGDGRFELEINDGLQIRAKNKATFGGRKQLRFSDFAAGQRLRITVDRSTGRPTKIRVIP